VEIAGHAVTREKMGALDGKMQQRTQELDDCRMQLQALHQERAQVHALGLERQADLPFLFVSFFWGSWPKCCVPSLPSAFVQAKPK
jgi:hypothetical protein